MNDPMTIEQIGTLSAVALGVAFVALVSVIISLYIGIKALFRSYDNYALISPNANHQVRPDDTRKGNAKK